MQRQEKTIGSGLSSCVKHVRYRVGRFTEFLELHNLQLPFLLLLHLESKSAILMTYVNILLHNLDFTVAQILCKRARKKRYHGAGTHQL